MRLRGQLTQGNKSGRWSRFDLGPQTRLVTVSVEKLEARDPRYLDNKEPDHKRTETCKGIWKWFHFSRGDSKMLSGLEPREAAREQTHGFVFHLRDFAELSSARGDRDNLALLLDPQHRGRVKIEHKQAYLPYV